MLMSGQQRVQLLLQTYFSLIEHLIYLDLTNIDCQKNKIHMIWISSNKLNAYFTDITSLHEVHMPHVTVYLNHMGGSWFPIIHENTLRLTLSSRIFFTIFTFPFSFPFPSPLSNFLTFFLISHTHDQRQDNGTR